MSAEDLLLCVGLTIVIGVLLVVFELYLTWCARKAANERKGRTER